MKVSQVKALIVACHKAGIKRAIHIVGTPGIGKTQLTGQVAIELAIGAKFIHGPLMQPEDYGFPVVSVNKDDVSFIVPANKFPLEGTDCPDEGILLIDELPQCDPSSQKVLTNLVQEREIHGRKLKPGWTIVTTGNPVTARAGANRLLSHLQNKITTIELEVSVDDWTQWALNNNVKTEVIAFIRFRPELLNAFNPQQDVNPTPRSWCEGVSARLGVVDPAIEFECFKGDVGEGPAAEFCAFVKIFRKLPNPDAILMNPKGADVPTDPATVYALVGAMVHKTTTANFGRIMEYITRMPSEFTVLYVRDAMRKVPGIQSTKDFIAWASGPGAKLLT